jgi:hypothetical protein
MNYAKGKSRYNPVRKKNTIKETIKETLAPEGE